MYDDQMEALILYNLKIGEELFEDLKFMSNESNKSVNRIIIEAIKKELYGKI